MRTARGRADSGAMPVAMLLTLVGVALSAVLASIVAEQIGAGRTEIQRVHALDAAQTGLDIAVGHIRAAADAGGNGVRASLPCGPMSGQVGVGGSAGYTVTIGYLDPDGAAVQCVSGAGAKFTPARAALVSVGTDGGGASRTLQAGYVLRTTNQNIAGGLIRVYRTTGSLDLCLDAGGAVPATGTPLRVQTCVADSDRQKFSYTSNLTLRLVSSATDAQPLGMCLDGGAVPHGTDGASVTLQPCTATVQPRQQWGFNDNANFEGTSDGSTLDGYCFNVQLPNSANSPVVLHTGNGTCYQSYTNVQNFVPEKQVGAGAAGAANKQLVNFDQFGRCLDVTQQNWAYSYLIASPCKQAPDPAQVRWNQKWVTPTAACTPAATGDTCGTIVTQPSYETSPFCLKSTLTPGAGQYATLAQCPGTPPVSMIWTMHGDTGVYRTSYTIVDSQGYCLSVTDPNDPVPDLHGGSAGISKIIVVVCTGSTLQKWNAPPYILQASPLKDIRER